MVYPSKVTESFGPESHIFVMLNELRKEIPPEKLITLSIGSPDGSPDPEIVAETVRQLHREDVHGYPSSVGLQTLREGIAQWYLDRFNVSLDPDSEVLVTMGGKRTLIDLAADFVNPGEILLVPDIGYSTYRVACLLAGGVPAYYHLIRDAGYNPDLSSIEKSVLKKTKLVFLNYPHNPTGAVEKPGTFEEATALALRYGFIICHDNPYSEIAFDGITNRSFLNCEGGREVGVELFSFSKLFNMAGWRIACLVGNKEIVQTVRRLKSDYDSGVFTPVQFAATKALAICKDHSIAARQSEKYQKRRDTVLSYLKELEWDYFKPQGAIYVWVSPPVRDTEEFVRKLARKTGVLLTPGRAFGPGGDGWVRISLVCDEATLQRAFDRIRRIDPLVYSS